MATPESLVYQGREGSGAAQIFGVPGNPTRAFNLRYQDAMNRGRYADAQRKLEKDKRDQRMLEVMAVSPEKTFQPFQDQVQSAADAHRKKVVDYFNNGGDPTNAAFANWNKSEWDKINNVARKGTFIQDKLKQTMDLIQKDPYLKEDYYLPKVFDLYMDEKGNGKPLDQVNVNAIESIYQNDPGGYDMQKYTKDFLGNIKDNVYNWVKKRNTKYGTETDDVELTVKGLLYTPDDSTSSKVKEDQYGNPILNVTNEVINSFIDSPNAKRFIEAEAERTGQDPRAIVTNLIQQELLTKGGGFKANIKPHDKMLPWNYYQEGQKIAGFGADEVPRASQRLRNIGDIMNAFWNDDGSRRDDPTPEAIQALNYIAKNTKFGDGEILEATFIPGNSKPGQSGVLGGLVENSPNDRIAFKVKFSDRGSPKVQTIDIDEQTGPALNGIFETAKTEGGYKVGYDQLINLNQTLGNQLFTSRIDRSYSNKNRAAVEQGRVDKWKNFEELDKLTGKQWDGKQIQSAKKKSGKYWWSDDTIEIKLDDGTTVEINPADEELADQTYDQLAKIHRQKNGVGESGINWK